MTKFFLKSAGVKILGMVAVVFFLVPSLANAGSQTFDGSGAQIFTVPAGVTEIIVTAAAQGGRGGAGYLDVIGGVLQGITGNQGGEGGNINLRRYTVTPGTTYSVVVNQSYLGPTSMLPLFSLTSGQDGDDAPAYGTSGYTGKGANGVPFDGVPLYYGVPGYCYEYGSDPICDPPGDSALGTGGLGGVAMYVYGRGATTPGGAGGAGFVDISWVDATVGTINVTSNIPGASFTLTGPTTLTGSVPATFTSQPTGMYTITWNNVLEYTKPGTSSQTLTSGGTLSFSGNYTPSTGPAANTCYWQTWFDPAGPGCMGDMSGEGYLLVGQTQDYSDAGTKWCGFCTAGPGASCSNTNVSGSTYRFTCNSTAPTIDVHF